MKLWITGSKGLLGSTLAPLCAKKGIQTVGTSHAELDICHEEQVQNFLEKQQVTHIVNCAAYTDVNRAEDEPLQAYRINAEGPENLGRIAERLGVKLLHISTDFVFSGSKKEPYLETDFCEPKSVYGMSKWEGEKRLLAAMPSACIVRTSNLFGHKGKNTTSQLFDLLKTKEAVRLASDLVSCATYSVDLAEAMLLLLPESGIFHFVNKGASNRVEIAQLALSLLQIRNPERHYATICSLPAKECFPKEIRPHYSVLSTQKIEKLLGITPRSWKSALAEYAEDAL